jgi:hypothetical protein
LRHGASLLLLGLLAASAAGAELPPEDDCAGIYWDLTAVFEEGDHLYARVLLSRVGPGDLSAAGQGHWRSPDGVETPFHNGRRAGRFEIGEAGRRLRIGSTELDLSAREHRFEVDNDKRGVKLRVVVDASDVAAHAVYAGDLAIEVVHLGSPARAHVWRRGMAAPRTLRGHATIVRTTHAACERDLASMRVDVHHLDAERASLLIHQRLTGGRERTWLGWRDGEGLLHTRRPERTKLEGWRRTSSGDALPQRLRPEDHGLSGQIAIGLPLLAADPLDALPRLVRMLYWFGASPRRVWADANTDLTVGSDTPAPPPRGPALASFTFLRESSATGPSQPGG